MLNNVYEVIRKGQTFYVGIVPSDLANGRYQIISFDLNNIHHGSYESVEDAERLLELFRQQGRFDSIRKVKAEIRTVCEC